MAVTVGQSAPAEYRTTSGAFRTYFVRKGIRQIVLVGGLAIFTVWTLFPFVWIVETSIKPDRDLYRTISLWPRRVTDAHYVEVLRETPFLTYFRNSFLVAGATTVIAMTI